MFEPFPEFWCCLSEGWRAMLDFMGGILALPDPVVALSTYDAEWEANIGAVGTPVYLYFAETFSITFGEVEVIPGVPLEAAIWTIELYLAYNTFKLSSGWACDTPCRYTSGYFALP